MLPNFDIAHRIAIELSNAETDHNELAKASTYLNQIDNSADFFEWLDWMATPRISEQLARSKRTPVYYQQIRNSCRQLRSIDDVGTMAQTLAWAVRLMRYYPHAKPVPPEKAVAWSPNKKPATLIAPDAAASAPKPVSSPTKATPPPAPTLAIQLTSVEQATPGMLAKASVRLIENNRMLIDLGIGEDAVIIFDRLPGKPTDPDVVALRYPAGTPLEVRLQERNKRGKLQAALEIP